ncbi:MULTISPECIES: hypothetical protein [Exiguobacterium]|uniref:hypothetical protein n=1 Tax=Exiguobacterium TaxID=33986 RepID=UPI00047981A2|nr:MULTISPECIES: hypothetical protein [Exiguobacterium]MCK2157204.1 hypothetical protein [Exiguobacterium sp. 17-1]
MNKEDHQIARKLVSTYLTGTQISTIHLTGFISIELINLYDATIPDISIRIETDRLYYGDVESSKDWVVRHMPKEEMLHLIVTLHTERIIAVRIGKAAPHLFITFSSGKTLVINGSDTYYESWAIDMALPDKGLVSIVAVPGDELAVFASDNTMLQNQSHE